MDIGNQMVRIGPRACRVDAVEGFYPGRETEKGDRGCWVVIRGQEPLSLAWTVETAHVIWTRRMVDLGRYVGLFDERGRIRSELAQETAERNRAVLTTCMLETDDETYSCREAELWGTGRKPDAR